MSLMKKSPVATMTRIEEVSKPMYARYTPEFLKKLCEIWPSKTGQIGITQAELARGAGISTGAISKYFGGRKPDFEELEKLDQFFKIVSFSSDGMKVIDNDQVLKTVKAFWEEHLRQNA